VIKLNNIKEARKKRNVGQSALAKGLNITQQAISAYENGTRTPDEKTLVNIANFLDTTTFYLKGETDDIDSWDIWEKYSGYTKEKIQEEISRMEKYNHTVDSDKKQDSISQAVQNFEGLGNTDYGILNHIDISLSSIQDELNLRYRDPKKLEKFKVNNSNLQIIPQGVPTKDLIFSDLNPEIYDKVSEILFQTKKDIRKISGNLKIE
jgi:transcriptional regulator with XRE-family HTH domain